MTPEAQALVELAAKVEAVTGADRELDAAIAVAMRVAPTLAPWAAKFPDWRVGSAFGRPRAEAWSDGELIGHWSEFAAYTGSVDAAMSLVPDGQDWFVTAIRPLTRRFSAAVYRGKHPAIDYSEAATPALALCAASLRALSLIEATHGEGGVG